jgi:hypothetical protein
MDAGHRATSADFGRLAKVLQDVSGGNPSSLPPWLSVDGRKGNFQRRFKGFGSFDVTVPTSLKTIIERSVRTDE